MEWQVDGEDLQWKIMVMCQDGVFFAGEKSLVRSQSEAKWFDTYSEAARASIEIAVYNLSGVSQIRIISSAFGQGIG